MQIGPYQLHNPLILAPIAGVSDRPFRKLCHYLRTGTRLPPPDPDEVRNTVIRHLENLYDFYGEHTAVRPARRHIGWYSKRYRGGHRFRQSMHEVDNAKEQRQWVRAFFDAFIEEQTVTAA
jgi:tRNA-dihydrouridine synthase B